MVNKEGIMNTKQNIDIYKEIRNLILTRKVFPNYQLVESKIAEQFGVSRTPVRSALQKLAYEGFVNIIPNKGTFVSQPSVTELNNIFELRKLLEPKAARLAHKNADKNFLSLLSNYLEEETESYNNRNLEDFFKANRNIHLLIAKTSKNDYLIKYIEELITKSDIYLVFYDDFYTKPIDDLLSIKEHLQIFDSFCNSDEEECENIMLNHIKSIFENLNLNILQMKLGL